MVKVYNLCRVKTNRLSVLTVKNGLDPHIINLIKDGFKSFSSYFLWPCRVPTISVLTLAYCCSEGNVAVKSFGRWCWVLGVRNPQSIACEVEAFVSRISCITLIIINYYIFSFLWYCYWLFSCNVSICMKLDPGIHMVMHSVLSLKSGVTQIIWTTCWLKIYYLYI